MSEVLKGARVVVVDDDPELRALIAAFLAEQGLQVQTAGDALALGEVLAAGPVDLIILDVMMPGEDGLSVVRRLQGEPRPAVIILSAMGDEQDRIDGLELGADDYLPKPCNPRELLARVRAVLRRRQGPGQARARVRRFGDCTLDIVTRRLGLASGTQVTLTDAEFRVLTALLDGPQQVFSRDQLLDVARGEGVDIFDRAIDVTISRLRRKLGAPDLIRTVRNEGYMVTLVPEDA
jgi:two-component system OmpR family response regulator